MGVSQIFELIVLRRRHAKVDKQQEWPLNSFNMNQHELVIAKPCVCDINRCGTIEVAFHLIAYMCIICAHDAPHFPIVLST